MGQKLKEKPLYDHATDNNDKNLFWCSVWQSGEEGAAGTYVSKRIRKTDIPKIASEWTYEEVVITTAEILDIGSTPKVLLTAPGADIYLDYIFDLLYIPNPVSPVGFDLSLKQLFVGDFASSGLGIQIQQSFFSGVNKNIAQVSSRNIIGAVDGLSGLPVTWYHPTNVPIVLTTVDGTNPTAGNGSILVKKWFKLKTFGTEL